MSRKFHVAVGENIKFLVDFQPKASTKMAAELRFSVLNNPFEENVIQLVGEGYEESVTIDNIHSSVDHVFDDDQSNVMFEGDEVVG